MKSKLLTYTQYKPSLPALFIATLTSTQFPKLSFLRIQHTMFLHPLNTTKASKKILK